MPQIALPAEFFVKERNSAYADWRAAFWRELISNSVDAGATEISISLDAANRTITFADNGCGMSRETCEHVYLSVGRSSKGAESPGVGGFGRARILTCFSMESYSVRGADYLVQGQGAEYSVTKVPERAQPGLTVSVAVQEDDWIPNIMLSRLTGYLKQCHLPNVRFVVDGKLLSPENFSRFSLPNADGTPLQLTDAGEIWGYAHALNVGKLDENPGTFTNIHANYIYWRVNGLCMFCEWHAMEGLSIVIELVPAYCRTVLGLMRDSVRHDYQVAARALAQRMNRQGASALSNARVRKGEMALTPDGKVKAFRPPSRAGLSNRDPSLQERLYKSVNVRKQAGGTPMSFISTDGYNNRLCAIYTDSADPAIIAAAERWRPGKELQYMRILRSV